jgi:Raf kinase inhibitor-like YbhB/YbcL family protein
MLEKIPSFVGRSLTRVRSGFDRIVALRAGVALAPTSIVVTSAAFREGDALPARFTADGPGISPPLAWRDIPEAARALAIVIEDADSPSPMPLVHGIAVRLPPRDGALDEGDLRETGAPVVVGRNSFFSAAWLPPDPPPGHGDHRYVFQVFAVDRELELGAHHGRSALVDALAGHTLARGLLVGTYRRSS